MHLVKSTINCSQDQFTLLPHTMKLFHHRKDESCRYISFDTPFFRMYWYFLYVRLKDRSYCILQGDWNYHEFLKFYVIFALNYIYIYDTSFFRMYWYLLFVRLKDLSYCILQGDRNYHEFIKFYVYFMIIFPIFK